MELSDRDFSLQLILANEDAGMLVDENQLKENLHFYRLYEIGKSLSSFYTSDTVNFRVSDSGKMNAVAVYQTKSVVACRGALNGILQIAERIVEAGFFPEMGNIVTPEIKEPNFHSVASHREILKPAENFSINLEEKTWGKNSERVALFKIISEILMGFLVCHEIGHHFNNHGRNKNTTANRSVDIDDMNGPLNGGSLDKQALESVADDCGFQMLIQHFDSALSLPVRHPELDLLRKKFIRTPEDLILRCSQMAYIYFYFMEMPGWQDRNPMEWTYPPAGFRFHTIYASMLEHQHLGVQRDFLLVLLGETIISTETMISQSFDVESKLSWMTEMAKYKEHAEKVIERMAAWSHTGEKVWEPYKEKEEEA
jgi:hypothetical protein